MMRAMTALCAVATAFACTTTEAKASAATRASTSAEAPKRALSHTRAPSHAKPSADARVRARAALPERQRGPTSPSTHATVRAATHDDERASHESRSPAHESRASSAVARSSATGGKDAAESPRKPSPHGRAAENDDDGIVEFEEPSDAVGVSGRSRSVVKLAEVARDDGKHGKKRVKGRPVRPVPLNASWRPYRREPWRRGYVSVAGHGKSWSGYVVDRNGDVLPAGRRALSEALASWRTGREMLIDERLVGLVADVSDEFGGRPIRIVSGYRETSYAPGSKHKVGQAFDFSVPGVPNEALRDFLRSLPDVGVGYYPNSTHVHLDVRETPCYWVDYSTPGAHPMYAYDRRVARMSPKERILAAQLDALASRRVSLGRPVTETVQRRVPLVGATEESRAKSALPPSRAAFEEVDLATPSLLLAPDAGAPHAASRAATSHALGSAPAVWPAPEVDAGRAGDAGPSHDAGAPR